MGKKLVIVESPAKAKTINRILGSDYKVTSSVGHVRDLPVKNMGVDIKDGFKPKYVIAKGKQKIIDQLKKDAKECDEIYLAPDPDREGEAIAWHISEVLKPVAPDKPFHRVQYNEITKRAVLEAFAHPGEIDMDRVAAQQARRVLDRIVGYMVSPMLWRRVKRGLSAGRVQSVALRLVCEREIEIRAFVAEAFWVLGARVRKLVAPLELFTIELSKIDGGKPEVKSEEHAATIQAELERCSLKVTDVERKTVQKRPPPPFITSTLQQAGSSRHNLSPSRTMSLAQKLYEGVDLGEGAAGLITYMRTDSFNVSTEAVSACRELIVETYGPDYCPEQPNVYRSRKGAQEAHEAIRPTDVRRVPESLSGHLDAQQLKLYRLIWERFVASQMTPAKIDQRIVSVAPAPDPDRHHEYVFQARASQVAFPGFMKAAGIDATTETEDAEEDQALPEVEVGESLTCEEWLSERKETRPPPRFTEASLVRAMEANGVGRPSTYAQTIFTLQQRQYVTRQKRTLFPTDLGLQVSELLVQWLGQLFDVKFTASMEDALDEVEKGSQEWTLMLAEFYEKFDGWMALSREPPASMDVVMRVLAILGQVQEWAEPVKRGNRTFSDKKFTESIGRQAETGSRPVTNRQLDALLKIGAKYKEQVPEVVALIEEAGRDDFLLQAENAGASEATTQKMACLDGVDMDESAQKFVQSLQARVDGGRELSEAQAGALGNIILNHAAQIENFEKLNQVWGMEIPIHAEDGESGVLLEAMSAVKAWLEPVTRGKRVFDDEKFYESLAAHYGRKKFLSPRQKSALKRMVRKYKSQIPDYERLAEIGGLTDKEKP